MNRLEKNKKAGYNVDERLISEVEKPGSLYLLNIEDKDTFYSLIWHEIDATRILTPANRPRTLYDIANRIAENKYTFTQLAQNMGQQNSEHCPKWFKNCVLINAQFDFSKFGWITLVLANDQERRQSPEGTFYIYDGAHKTLVLAKKLLLGEIRYQPIEALLLVPRRS